MFQCKVLKPCCCSCREEEAGSADWLCLLLNRVNWSPQKNPLGTRTVTQTTCHSAHSPVPPACVRMSDKHGQNPPEWAGRQLTFLVTIVLVSSTTSKKRWVPWKESTSKQEFQKAGDKGRTALWYICRLLLYQHMWWVMKGGGGCGWGEGSETPTAVNTSHVFLFNWVFTEWVLHRQTGAWAGWDEKKHTHTETMWNVLDEPLSARWMGLHSKGRQKKIAHSSVIWRYTSGKLSQTEDVRFWKPSSGTWTVNTERNVCKSMRTRCTVHKHYSAVTLAHLTASWEMGPSL